MPSNSSGTLNAVMPRLGGLGDQVGRVGRGRVGVMGGRAQNLRGELAGRCPHDHLLVFVRIQVEVVRPARLQARRGAVHSGNALERPAHGAGGGKRRLDAVLQAAVHGIPQVVLVQELLADKRCDQRQTDVGRCPLVSLESDGALRALAHGALGGAGRCAVLRKGVGHFDSLASLGQCVMTVSYSGVRYGARVIKFTFGDSAAYARKPALNAGFMPSRHQERAASTFSCSDPLVATALSPCGGRAGQVRERPAGLADDDVQRGQIPEFDLRFDGDVDRTFGQ